MRKCQYLGRINDAHQSGTFLLVLKLLLRACFHAAGGPRVSKVTRLAVVEKKKRVYVQSYNPEVLGWGFLRLLLRLLSRGVIHVRNCWLNTLYRIFWETKYGRFTTLNIPKCEQVTLLVCPLRFLVIPSMRRLGNVQSFKTFMFRFWAFCMNATPARRVTPP